MVWVIASKNTPKSQFQKLRGRLSVSYLSVMLVILGVSTTAVYGLFIRTLYQQLDRRLLNLADAASHSLVTIEKQYPTFQQRVHPPIFLDNDGDLDIPWQDIIQRQVQGVEWFDAKGKLLAKTGRVFPTKPLEEGALTQPETQLRVLTIPVYKEKSKTQRQGYVRVSESVESVEAVLTQLRWGLGLGGLLALSLSAIGSMWLTRQSLKPVEESFEQLKQFTADASHELRNPLTAIVTSIEVMQSHPERIHPLDVKKLTAIASASNQMTRLVEDLLLLTRIDVTATAATKHISIPLDEVLEDLVDAMEAQVEAKGLSLKVDIQPNIYVMGDGVQLRRLFANLIDNAIHYTPSGGTLKILMTKQERSVMVSVADTGIGIAPEQLKLVFHRFWRADTARSWCDGGLGMGLAIAQGITHAHGGGITVKSQVGVGSCFTVRLPLTTFNISNISR